FANPPGCGSPIYAGPALDGSGIYADLQTGTILKDGSRIGEDTNGNLFSQTSSGTLQDTFQRTLLTYRSGANYKTWTYTDSQGQSQTFRVDYATKNVQTNWCGIIPHAPDPGGSVPSGCLDFAGQESVPIKLTLPDQTAYQFNWLDNSVVELLSVQLPTGATISYTYNDLHEAQPNWPGRFPPPPCPIRKTVATRTVTVGAQSFEWSYGVNSSGVTVTNPDTSSETHVLSKIGTAPYTVPVESQVSYHDASGKVIRTVAKTWTGE